MQVSILRRRRETFDNLDMWQMQALENAPEDVIYVLVGTHLDMAEKYQWSKAGGR
jgi:uncharacterized protein YbjT (DUF2867 family)